jgi:hypothetical protein
MMRLKDSLSNLGLVIAASTCVFASVRASAADSELNLRLGAFHSTFNGPINGSTDWMPVLETEYSVFLSNRRALAFRYDIASALPDLKGDYSFAGVGIRQFIRSKGVPVEGDSDGIVIRVHSEWRQSIGLDVGIAQMIVQSFGKAVNVTSSLVEVDLRYGATYQIDDRFGVGAVAQLGLGYGFSSVSVNTVNTQAMGSLSYFF